MASKKHVFEEWLSEKLKSLELDTDIYVDYFFSVLDETQTDIEVKESLQDILGGVLVRLQIEIVWVDIWQFTQLFGWKWHFLAKKHDTI